ncbi:DUF2809 domain-containing protein [Enterocloster asparagiformis]|uniref:DUF2809 domain-containing protein n=1 Tax=Enterocloster asparagiformis TaxID=333367 RepID=UPI0004B6E082|nr:DUF2809 domain-containing protein [Enterocloster asparagiformis]
MEKATNNQLRLRYTLAFLALFALEAFIALRVRDRFVRPYLGDVMVVWVVYCFVRAVRPRGGSGCRFTCSGLPPWWNGCNS